MIPFVDVALAARLKDTFPMCTLVFASKKKAKQKISTIFGAQEDKSGKKDQLRGLPGIAIWRVTTNKIDSINTFSQSRMQGFPSDGYRDDDKKHFVFPVHQEVTYDLGVYCEHMTDRNNIERTLAFMTQFRPLLHNLFEPSKAVPECPPGQYDQLFKWEWSLSDPVYDEEENEKTGGYQFLSADYKAIVRAPWIKDAQFDIIKQLKIDYKAITSGDPIDDELLSSILSPDPAVDPS